MTELLTEETNIASKIPQWDDYTIAQIQERLRDSFRENHVAKLRETFGEYFSYLQSKKETEPTIVEHFLFSYLKNITNESLRMGVSVERFESYVPAVVYLMQSDEMGCAEATMQLTEQLLKHINGHRGNESNHLLHMAKDFIMDNIANEHLDLAAVSDHVGLSRVYFCKLFHQMEGISFSAYLKKVRIDKAKQLLLSTNMKVFEVSNAVGFSHAKYFGHVFKEVVGQTPASYQRNEKSDT